MKEPTEEQIGFFASDAPPMAERRPAYLVQPNSTMGVQVAREMVRKDEDVEATAERLGLRVEFCRESLRIAGYEQCDGCEAWYLSMDLEDGPGWGVDRVCALCNEEAKTR